MHGICLGCTQVEFEPYKLHYVRKETEIKPAKESKTVTYFCNLPQYVRNSHTHFIFFYFVSFGINIVLHLPKCNSLLLKYSLRGYQHIIHTTCVSRESFSLTSYFMANNKRSSRVHETVKWSWMIKKRNSGYNRWKVRDRGTGWHGSYSSASCSSMESINSLISLSFCSHFSISSPNSSVSPST